MDLNELTKEQRQELKNEIQVEMEAAKKAEEAKEIKEFEEISGPDEPKEEGGNDGEE